MPERDWLHITTTGSLILVAVIALFGPAVTRDSRQLTHDQPAGYTGDAKPGGKEKSAEQWAAETCATANQASNEDTEKRVKDDLCAQFRSAAASERSAIFAQQQVVIATFAFFALLITLYLGGRANEAATKAANAAIASIELQRKTSVAELRPYVNFLQTNTVRHRVDKKTFQSYGMTIVWKNSGQTPARAMAIHNTVRIETAPLPEGYHFPEGKAEGPRAMAPLGPDDERMAPLGNRPIEDLLGAWLGLVHIHVYGWVEYSDDFPGSPRYRTEYAFKLNVRSDPRLEECIFEYEVLPANNGMDEDCMFLPSTQS